MDPQHRIFFETAWEALESAGYVGETYPGAVGVFATCGISTYLIHHLVSDRALMESAGEWAVRHTANEANFLATRVSYELGLTGPSMNVQTACSSALVAVHLAAQSLLAGECDMALAGASTITLPQDRGYFYREGGILSPDGCCRPFDAHANGTAFGSGAGCVVLKRLGDALADGDDVLAILRGTAINNDGSAKIGYLAPSVEGQARVVAEALAVAGVDPRTISYVETHGTGTLLGDAIEIAALTRAYRASTSATGYCAIGSVKPNIGHIGEAAGIAAFIKAVLALSHRELPPSLGYRTPSPEIDFGHSPFFVNTELRAWAASGPRRAGVTALGVGGTNAHAILEEAPPLEQSGPSHAAEVLVLSAKTETALESAAKNLARHLRDNPGQPLADVAYTLQLGRKAFPCRRAVVCRDREDAIRALETGERSSSSAAELEALGARWAAGTDVDWRELHRGERRRRVPLPTYPFERRRFWIERSDAPAAVRSQAAIVLTETAPKRSTASYRAPRDAIERGLADSWSELLGVERVGVDDDFFDLGGQSLIAARLFDTIRATYGVDLPLSTLFEAPTVARCAAVLRGRIGEAGAAPASSWPSVVAIQPEGSRPPLYCVAGMGGNLVNLRRLAILLGTDRPFFGLQPPGLDGRHEKLYRVEELASRYLREILPARPDGHFLLGGYSGGGVVAFEMACQLARLGREVAFLGLIDSFSPSLPRCPYLDRAKIHARRTIDAGPAYLADLAGRRLRYERRELERRVKRVLGKVSPERYRYDNVADAWTIAEGAYRPPTFAGHATLFRAMEESSLTLATAFEIDAEHGWGRFVRGGVDVLACPGNHTTVCEEPHVRVLAEKVRESIDRAEGAGRRAVA
jgi:3-oxoacyl-(acyl-carrier-protein) synthase/thioesterase domain-containing protein